MYLNTRFILMNIVLIYWSHISFLCVVWYINSYPTNCKSLNSNGFGGPIPLAIGNLSKLCWPDLAGNQLSGNTPAANGITLVSTCFFTQSTCMCRFSSWLFVSLIGSYYPRSLSDSVVPSHTVILDRTNWVAQFLLNISLLKWFRCVCKFCCQIISPWRSVQSISNQIGASKAFTQ